jgi:hypothetical protein
LETEKNLLKEICSERREVNTRVLEQTITLAVEIAREGREGRKIGTLFVVGDSEAVLKNSRPLILDPLAGHPDEKKTYQRPGRPRDFKGARPARRRLCSFERRCRPLGGPLYRYDL